MAKRLFEIYVLVELAVLIALIATVGFGWTLLAVSVTFVVGLALAGSQVARHLGRLQSALSERSGSQALAGDSVLVALGALLVVVPGLASSVVGALLLMPPTRTVLRPAAKGVLQRRLAGQIPVPGYPGAARRRPQTADYIDGEVIDVTDVEPTAVEHRAV